MFLLAQAAATLAPKVLPSAAATLAPALQKQLQTQLNNQLNNGALQGVKTPMAIDHPFFTHTLAVMFLVAAVSLIVLLAIQTTKQEGLSGTIGGRVESAYRGRVGMDKQISRVTSTIAIAFVVLATLLSLTGI